MNKKLYDFIDRLSGYDCFKNLKYSLTINYDRKVSDHRPEIFDDESLGKIKNIISECDVKSFNLTLYDKDMELERNTDNGLMFKHGWYSINYIFYCDGDIFKGDDIKYELSFSSSYVSLMQLPNRIKDLDKLIKIASVYKETSKNLSKMHHGI